MGGGSGPSCNGGGQVQHGGVRSSCRGGGSGPAAGGGSGPAARGGSGLSWGGGVSKDRMQHEGMYLNAWRAVCLLRSTQ